MNIKCSKKLIVNDSVIMFNSPVHYWGGHTPQCNHLYKALAKLSVMAKKQGAINVHRVKQGLCYRLLSDFSIDLGKEFIKLLFTYLSCLTLLN